MCLGHSDEFLDDVYDIVVSASEYVDVAGMLPADGPFESALRNAITRISHRANPPIVRYLVASIPFARSDTDTLLAGLTRDLSPDVKMEVAVAAMRSRTLPVSWNHAKIIAADGRVAMVGGHNLWSGHYLDKEPVHDLSMRVQGTAAADAHRFANQLWDYTCDRLSSRYEVARGMTVSSWVNGRLRSECPARFESVAPEGPSSKTVFSVGHLGIGIDDDGDQADDALIAMIDAARSSIRMSLQDIGPVRSPYLKIPLGKWPDRVLDALGAAILRGVDVYLVMSNVGAVAGGLGSVEASYSNGWDIKKVAKKIRDRMDKIFDIDDDELDALVCQKLNIAPFKYSEDESWPGDVPIANHAKTMLVDDQAFYIGSQNLYSFLGNLQEFGYIVDDSSAARSYYERYWSKIWDASKSGAISGAEAQRCKL